MGGGASKIADRIAGKTHGTRLTLAELKNAASERLVSSWWLDDDRITKLFNLLDTNKNGHLDAMEYSFAISELARMSDHLLGVHVDIETQCRIDSFASALSAAGGAHARLDVQQALAAAVPLDVRAIEMQAMLVAMGRLEMRGAYVTTQLNALRAKIDSGTQSARGMELLRRQMEPLEATIEAAKEDLPRLELRLLSQCNAMSALVTPKLVESIDQHEAAFTPLAAEEAQALESVAAVVLAVNEKRCKSVHTKKPLRQDEPAQASSFGAYESKLPPPPDVRPALAHSFSLGAETKPATQLLASTSGGGHLATLMLLLDTATKAAAPLRQLCEQACNKLAEAEVKVMETEKAVAAVAEGAQLSEKAAKSSKARTPGKGKMKMKDAMWDYGAPDGCSMREAISGPVIKKIAACCEEAHDTYAGDFCRLLDLVRRGAARQCSPRSCSF